MRVSIRGKLTVLLLGVGSLPLLFALIVIVVVGSRVQVESFGERVRLAASAKSAAMQVSLAKDVERLLLAVRHRPVIEWLREPPREYTADELEALDAAWATMPRDEPIIAGVLDNPIVKELRLLERGQARFREILVTDRLGQLVAATGRTSDFYQGDESWWRISYDEGRGRICVPPIGYDASTETWSVDLCVPVMDDTGERALGVCKAVMDVSDWVGEVERRVGPLAGQAMLVRADGTVVYREGVEPLTTEAREWGPGIGGEGGWRIVRDSEIQGIAPVRLPDRIATLDVVAPGWALVLYMPIEEATGPIYRIGGLVLGGGIAAILTIFFIGLIVVDRALARRIRHLRTAARSVAEGDLDSRVRAGSSRRRVLGADELDELADDFNRMVDRVQNSYESLRTANRLKTDFIRVAGHELRTPVSYMLGMAKLMKDSTNRQQLLHAVQTMGAKAKRLNDIIQAMFKLMPGQLHAEEMQYTDVVLNDLLEEIYLDTFPFVEKRNQRLIVEMVENVPAIQADRGKLRDIVENLIMNAVKFTPDEGVVKVRVGLQLGGYVYISVQDQGPGIPSADMPHIFEPFYSGADVMTHSTGTSEHGKQGMGLGLAVVDHFVKMHGGDVRVSTSPHGTTFTVVLPIEAPPRSERPDQPE